MKCPDEMRHMTPPQINADDYYDAQSETMRKFEMLYDTGDCSATTRKRLYQIEIRARRLTGTQHL